jgi:hypothetical protein
MPAPSARPPRDEGPSGPLSIVLSCPKCGAPFAADDTIVTVTCAHCASLLILSAPGREEVYVAEDATRGADDVAEVAIRYRVLAERAEIVSRFADKDGNPPSEFFILGRLEEFERSLRRTVRVVDAYRLEVPYWHLTGELVQATLGRLGSGPKVVRLRAFDVEHTVPAYDTAQSDLRDRGLRLSRARVRPLVARDLRAKGPFLPFQPLTPQSYREIEKWKGRDLERGIEAVTRHAAYCHARHFLVYRPYWLARVAIEGALRWYLVDGSFDSIAGYPDEVEVASLLRQAIADPLGSEGERYRKVSIAPSRCPDCGAEARLDPAARVTVCANCHLALVPEPAGIRNVPYSHARIGQVTLDGDYLPFWRYEFRLEVPGAPPVSRLEDYARVLFPNGLPRGFAPKGAHLWVPAFRLLGTMIGDETFQELVQWIHAASLEVVDGKIPLGGNCEPWPATVGEADAREEAAFVPFAHHPNASAARLNTMLVARAVQKAKLTLTSSRLVMVPVSRDEEGKALVVRGTGVRIPLLLLRGGPELAAQRETVHKARAAVEEPGFPRISF